MEDKPMKWYDFLVNFALIANAILNGLTGVMYFSLYSGESNSVICIVCGVGAILCAVMALIVRLKLKEKRENAPMLFIVFQVLQIVIGIVGSALGGNVFAVVVGGTVSTVLNTIYFNKRSYMFIN